ncbi:MAG TPA: gephyrin-like molybdotransferase Glp [Chthoniobacterales bacterium]|nr:gephyrin-like molybdotransferase Glp [Chthoniobacterales bacterium]
MISESEARAKILELVHPLPPERVRILDALDRFAAEDVFARLPLPMFDNSAMDGYAVIAGETKNGQRLRVIGEQPAGIDRKLRVGKGEAIRIFTGAPIPSGADAVVMQEDVTREGDEIVLSTNAEPGEFIRRRGCDLSEGQKILRAGERLRAGSIGVLASQGVGDVAVGGQANVAIVSSGDEVAPAGTKLQPGQIYDSNSVMLQMLVKRCGANIASVQHCRDDAESLGSTLESAAQNHVVIITGGVSVGEHDLVQGVLRSLGAKIDLWRVAIKPGKPFLFGRLGCFLFGLPGNPVSAFVTFLQFVRPAILQLMGAGELSLPRVPAELASDLTNDGDRVHYFRGRLESGKFMPMGRQESHALFGLSQSNALFRLEPGESKKTGAKIDVDVWD